MKVSSPHTTVKLMASSRPFTMEDDSNPNKLELVLKESMKKKKKVTMLRRQFISTMAHVTQLRLKSYNLTA